MIPETLEHLAVPIDSVIGYPGNARRGDVPTIADSLSYHGQFCPIVVQRSTNYILAGNHTWQAARELGEDRIAVVFVDCDDDTARRINLGDNRAADAAFYDNPALLDFLDGLPDLDGTGFDEDDLEALRRSLEPPEEHDNDGSGSSEKGGTERILVGPFGFLADADDFADWAEDLFARDDALAIIGELRQRLGLTAAPPVRSRPPKADREAAGRGPIVHKDLLVPIDSITPHPENPRQGDVGMIANMLSEVGQYKPVVVNQQTLRIVKGNHTWHAAKRLGWTQIAATFVDKDEEEERRVLAVDNRSSDRATYDDRALLEALETLGGDLAATGFDEFDVELLESNMDDAGRPVRVAVGMWKFTTPASAFAEWESTTTSRVGSLPGDVCPEVARLLRYDGQIVGVIE